MTTYRDTLASPEWRALKFRRLMVAGFQCEGCGRRYYGPRIKSSMRHFNLHHLHYRTVGHESLDDVIVLCRICHRLEHGLIGR